MAETRSTCPYCGVGCGVIIESDGTQITGVRGDPEHPANFGRLCTKGSTLHLTAASEITRSARLLQPARRLHRGSALQTVDWSTALDTAADRIADVVRQHGPDAVGLYLSGQLLTEDYYVFNKLAKGLLGTNNIDTNSRLCMSSAVAGYKKTLGADAPPCSYEDFAHADTLFITGSNTAWAHPILFRRLEDARAARPGQRWIVVDVRNDPLGTPHIDMHCDPERPYVSAALPHGIRRTCNSMPLACCNRRRMSMSSPCNRPSACWMRNGGHRSVATVSVGVARTGMANNSNNAIQLNLPIPSHTSHGPILLVKNTLPHHV